jgi:hypothetical protein
MGKAKKQQQSPAIQALENLPKNWFNPDPVDIKKIAAANRAAERSKLSKYTIGKPLEIPK